MTRKPQVIVVSGTQSQVDNVSAFWLPQLVVPVIALNEDWFNRASPRILLAAQQLCQQMASIPTLSRSHINAGLLAGYLRYCGICYLWCITGRKTTYGSIWRTGFGVVTAVGVARSVTWH